MSRIPDTIELQRRQIQSLTDQLKAAKGKVVPEQYLGRSAAEWYDRFIAADTQIATYLGRLTKKDAELAKLKQELDQRDKTVPLLKKGDRIKILDVMVDGYDCRKEFINQVVIVDHEQSSPRLNYHNMWFTLETSTPSFAKHKTYDNEPTVYNQYIKYELVQDRPVKVVKSYTAQLNNKLCISLGKKPGTSYDQFELFREPKPNYWGKSPHAFSDVTVQDIYTLQLKGGQKFESCKIQAIKEVREILGWGLLESKQFIEGLSIRTGAGWCPVPTEDQARRLLDWADRNRVEIVVA